LTEIQKLKDSLEDAQARSARLETARETRAAELQAITEERASLIRTLSAKDLELNQLRSRADNLDSAMGELRARMSDVESARATAITRAETLAKENSVLESRADRAEMGLISRMAAFKNLTDSFEDHKARTNQEIQELSGLVARQKTELGMMRGALESSKRSKLLSPERDQ
jgi:crescentin